MLRLIKTLLIWLLLAAVPVQGIAAAAMMSCRSVERTAPSVSGPAHQHALHGDHHVGDVVSIDDHAGHHGHHDTHAKHAASTSCSACSVCCIGAAPVPADLDWTFIHNSSEPVDALPAPFMTGFIPSSLERPPRLIAA